MVALSSTNGSIQWQADLDMPLPPGVCLLVLCLCLCLLLCLCVCVCLWFVLVAGGGGGGVDGVRAGTSRSITGTCIIFCHPSALRYITLLYDCQWVRTISHAPQGHVTAPPMLDMDGALSGTM